MAERIEVSQRMQLGLEAVPGRFTAATKIMQSLKSMPKIMTAGDRFVPSGYYYPTVVAVNEEWTEPDLTGALTYEELIYTLGSLINTPSIAPIAGGSAWTFQGHLNAPDVPYTYTVEIGDPGAGDAERVSGAQIIDGTYTFTRKSTSFKGKMLATILDLNAPMTVGPAANAVQTLTLANATGGTFDLTYLGQRLTFAYNAPVLTIQGALTALGSIGTGNLTVTGTPGTSYVFTFGGALAATYIDPIAVDGSALTGTGPTAVMVQTTIGSGAAPTALTLTPILGNQLDVFLDTSYAALGTTYLERDFSIDVGLTGRYGPIWPMRTAHTSYAASVGLEPKSSVKFVLEADAVGKTVLGYMRAGSTFYVRIQATGPVLGAGTRYLLQIDMPLKIASPGPFSAQEGVHALEFDAELVSDPTAGFPIRVLLQNELTAP